MSEELILIGVIMVVSGIIVFFFGRARGVPNALLWALFPIFHGLHEFADYSLEIVGDIFIIEQFEIIFSVAGAFALLAAIIEFNGTVARPAGKLMGLIGLIVVGYFIFALPAELIEGIEHTVFSIGVLETNPLRFFQGMFMTILAILAVLFTTLSLFIKSKRGEIDYDKESTEIAMISIILLGIYAFFEGFDSQDPIFVTLRGVSLAFFIVVPVYFILINRVGLQRLLIIKNGVPIVGYTFTLGQFIDLHSERSNDIILAAGFISAISSFSGEVLKQGKTFSIRSDKLYFIISEFDGTNYALQTLHISRNLENDFGEFVRKVNPDLQNVDQPVDTEDESVKRKIRESFSRYY